MSRFVEHDRCERVFIVKHAEKPSIHEDFAT